jgi:hypothetical protein
VQQSQQEDAVPVTRNPQGYSQLLRDQYSLLRGSVVAFYGGNSAAALDIAVRLRTLVHFPETKSGQEPHPPFLSLVNPDYARLSIYHKVPTPGAVLAVNQAFVISNTGTRFIREDFTSPSYVLVPLERWWGEEYLALGTIRSSKKQVILDVANKDGGAHVDVNIPIRHAAASEPPVLLGNEGEFIRPNLARTTVAQAGNELVEYLECHFRRDLKGVLPEADVETVKKAARRAAFQHVPVKDPIRVLFSRAANFLNVHTDGKWAFYTEISDGKKPDHWGLDFESLLAFLNSPA